MSQITDFAPVPAGRPISRSWRRLFRRGPAIFGGIVLSVVFISAVLPVSLLPYDPRVGDQQLRLVPPAFFAGGSADHLLGTDAIGRDVFSMLVAGARYTLIIVLCAAVIGLVLGTTLGMMAAYWEGRLGAFIMRLADVQLAFPVMVLLIAIVAAFGSSVFTLALILGITAWAPYARLVYTSVLSLKQMEFVESARAAGLGPFRIMGKHLLPNLTSTLVVMTTFDLAQLVVVESSLSFLGLGVQPPNPSWGTMIADAREYIYDAWWASAVPGVAIVLTVLAFSLLGDELRDVLDPASGK